MTRWSRGLKGLLVTTACAVAFSGCDFSVANMPLPGGTDVGEDPIEITAEFRNVLDLVPQTTVKVNDVSVGQVTGIDLEGETAIVTMELPRDTELPDNAVAEIRQTSLLGEKFVQLAPPETGASDATLTDGDVIELADTGRNPEVEEVLGALSLLLNGGGVAQMKTIAHELNLALEGREDSAKSVFRQIRELMSQLDEGKADIVAAIEGLNRLSIVLNDQIGTIDAALEELPSALVTLDKQRKDLVRMLQALSELGDTGVRVIKASKEATIESFRQLVPVLSQFANSGDAFVDAFHVFLTYPFVDEVVGRDPQVARNLHMGDYTNLSVQMEVHVEGGGGDGPGEPTGLPTDLPTIIDPTAVVNDVVKCLQSEDITSKACQKVFKDADLYKKLKEACKKPKHKDNEVCVFVNTLPDSPLPSSTGGPLDPITTGLPVQAMERAAGALTVERWGARGPTMGELMDLYDPALVSLLVPGMVTR